jgi:hypothetical protein
VRAGRRRGGRGLRLVGRTRTRNRGGEGFSVCVLNERWALSVRAYTATIFYFFSLLRIGGCEPRWQQPEPASFQRNTQWSAASSPFSSFFSFLSRAVCRKHLHYAVLSGSDPQTRPQVQASSSTLFF